MPSEYPQTPSGSRGDVLGVLDCFGLVGDVVVITGYRPETFADVGADLALTDVDAEDLSTVAGELDADTLELEVDLSDPEQVAVTVHR